MPYLEKLRDFTKESISLAVLDGEDIVYIAKADSHEVLRTNIEIGKKFPAYKTALGKILLAHLSPKQFNHLFNKDKLVSTDSFFDFNYFELKKYLEKAKEKGIAFDDEEATPDIRCMAAPIVGVNGEVSTAISISGPKVRFTEEKIDLWKRELVKVARKISFNIPGTPHQ